MTRRLEQLAEIAGSFEVIVLDQWGVLHDGSAAYPGAKACLSGLKQSGQRLAVLSNSGKRAASNADRISDMGFDPALFDVVMTSGEALWRDVAEGRVTEHALFPIERAEGDAAAWADGLNVTFTGTLAAADAVLLMGLPDGEGEGAYATLLGKARAARLPVICTNPDRASPRADGGIVVSPGALAHAYADLGGDVRFYGKPHLPVFRALEAALGATPAQILMVGDSLEHDVAGGHSAGWATAFVEGGLYAAEFAGTDPVGTLTRIAEASAAPMPDYSIARLQ